MESTNAYSVALPFIALADNISSVTDATQIYPDSGHEFEIGLTL
jgi:hypothetical protein